MTEFISYFFKILAAREFDVPLPKVGQNVMETLDPGNSDGIQDLGIELSQATSDIEALAAISESIANQEKNNKRDKSMSRRQRRNAPAPMTQLNEPQEYCVAESEELLAGQHIPNVPSLVTHTNTPADAQISISTPSSTSPFVGRTVTDILRARAKYKEGALTLVVAPVNVASQPMSHIQRDIAERGLPETTPTGPKRKRDARDDYASPSLKGKSTS